MLVDPQGTRRAKRITVNWPAVLLEGGKRSVCTVINISVNGAKLRANHAIPRGSTIGLVSEHFGALDAAVTWCKSEAVGIRFVDPPERVAVKLRPALGDFDKRKARAKTTPTQFGRRTYHGRRRRDG